MTSTQYRRALAYVRARTLAERWDLLSSDERSEAARLVRQYGYPVELAMQQAYLFGRSAWAYDYRTKQNVLDVVSV